METTTSLNDDTIDAVQNLIEINLDSHKGFETAAEQLEGSPQLATYFRECGQERQRFARDLQSVVSVNGESPERSGSLKGTAHRWWLEIRGAVQSGDEHAVLAEAERGEDAIKHEYEDVLKSTAGSPLNKTLQQQYAEVKRRHDQIRDMRDARAES
ncbi:MAG: PA2169 family four-helix-bundle protein [Phycisphaerales bacterium JB059]